MDIRKLNNGWIAVDTECIVKRYPNRMHLLQDLLLTEIFHIMYFIDVHFQHCCKYPGERNKASKYNVTSNRGYGHVS